MRRFMKATILVVASCSICFSEVSEAEKALAKESEAKCVETASTKATPKLIKTKVAAAVALLNKEGKAAYAKFKGKGSEFLFAGTYIWINDYDGVMLMHPIKPAMVGKALLGLKDGNGKRFFVDMVDVVKNKGEGWVDYTWPKPGEKERSLKVSYVKKATVDGTPVVVGCGTYDLADAEVQKLIAQ